MPGPIRVAFAVAWLAAAARLAAAAPPTKPLEAAPVNLGRPVDFEKDVAPILETNCVACHNATISESKLNLETAESIRTGGKRGPAVVPGRPAASPLFQLASRSRRPAMPPLPNTVDANALSPKELGILQQWIVEGAGGSGAGTRDSIAWQPIPASVKSIESVALSPWGRFAAAARANQIVIYDLPLGHETARLVDPLLSDVEFEGRPMYPGGAADRDFIHALAFSPDGSLLAAGGYRAVKIWKRPHNVRKWTAALPQKPTALAVNPARTLLAIATADKTIDLLSTAGGVALRKLSAPAGLVTALQFSSDGKTLYAGSLDKSWRSWNAADGSPRDAVLAPSAINAIAVSKDGKQLFAGCADGIIRVWSLAPAKPRATYGKVREWKGHKNGVTSLAVMNRDNSRHEVQLVSGGEDGTVRIWDVASGKEAGRFNHGGPVMAVAVRPDGRVVASAGLDKIARLWSIKEDKPIAEMKGDLDAVRLVTLRTDTVAVARQHLEAAGNRVQVAEKDFGERGQETKKLAEPRKTADRALSIAKSSEKAALDAVAAAQKALKAKPADAAAKKRAGEAAKVAAAAAEATKIAAATLAKLVRADERAEKSLQIATTRLKHVQFEKTVAETAVKKAEGQLAQATAAGTQRTLPIRTLAFSADGNVLATAGDNPAVQLWDARTGRALQSETGHHAGVDHMSFLGNSTLVSAAADGSVIAWDTDPPWKLVGRIGPKAGAPLVMSESLFAGRVLCVAFNPEGTLLAAGGGEPSRSGELTLWNIPSFTLCRDIKDAHSDTVCGVAFSPDGKSVASGAADKFLKVFDVATGALARSFEGHTHHVLGVAWKADGSLLASAGADSQIKLWNFETGEQVRSIGSYEKQVTSVQFIGTGGDIVSAGGDKTVRLHHTPDGDNYRTLEGGTDFMYSAAATRDGSIIAAAGGDGVLRIWNGENGRPLFKFAPPPAQRDAAQASALKR